MKRLVVLASGNGSNAQAIIDACASGELPAEVMAVVSDRGDARALVRADARTAEVAAAFLHDAAALARDAPGVTIYPVVPPHVAKVADVQRMQMLLESPSRSVLQRMLAQWLPRLQGLRAGHKGLLRWAVDVDPLAI